jgi:hypothetical protein
MAAEVGGGENVFRLAGFTFFADFDSGNLGHVRLDAGEEREAETPQSSTSNVSATDDPDFRFSLWTRPDCQGTEFENGSRSWFYFGLKGGPPGAVVQVTLQNLNKQKELFSQGMVPVVQVAGHQAGWERLRDQPVYWVQDDTFYMSFRFR